VLLSIRTTKLASITQNNHVYEYTAEGPTPEVLLNIRNPYRRQKRDFSIIRLLFRRPYTRIEIPAINTTIYLPPDYIDYFLPFYLLAIISTIYYRYIYQKQSILTQPIKNRARFAIFRRNKLSSQSDSRTISYV
jgi:hypothetical protein